MEEKFYSFNAVYISLASNKRHSGIIDNTQDNLLRFNEQFNINTFANIKNQISLPKGTKNLNPKDVKREILKTFSEISFAIEENMLKNFNSQGKEYYLSFLISIYSEKVSEKGIYLGKSKNMIEDSPDFISFEEIYQYILGIPFNTEDNELDEIYQKEEDLIKEKLNYIDSSRVQLFFIFNGFNESLYTVSKDLLLKKMMKLSETQIFKADNYVKYSLIEPENVIDFKGTTSILIKEETSSFLLDYMQSIIDGKSKDSKPYFVNKGIYISSNNNYNLKYPKVEFNTDFEFQEPFFINRYIPHKLVIFITLLFLFLSILIFTFFNPWNYLFLLEENKCIKVPYQEPFKFESLVTRKQNYYYFHDFQIQADKKLFPVFAYSFEYMDGPVQMYLINQSSKYYIQNDLPGNYLLSSIYVQNIKVESKNGHYNGYFHKGENEDLSFYISSPKKFFGEIKIKYQKAICGWCVMDQNILQIVFCFIWFIFFNILSGIIVPFTFILYILLIYLHKPLKNDKKIVKLSLWNELIQKVVLFMFPIYYVESLWMYIRRLNSKTPKYSLKESIIGSILYILILIFYSEELILDLFNSDYNYFLLFEKRLSLFLLNLFGLLLSLTPVLMYILTSILILKYRKKFEFWIFLQDYNYIDLLLNILLFLFIMTVYILYLIIYMRYSKIYKTLLDHNEEKFLNYIYIYEIFTKFQVTISLFIHIRLLFSIIFSEKKIIFLLENILNDPLIYNYKISLFKRYREFYYQLDQNIAIIFFHYSFILSFICVFSQVKSINYHEIHKFYYYFPIITVIIAILLVLKIFEKLIIIIKIKITKPSVYERIKLVIFDIYKSLRNHLVSIICGFLIAYGIVIIVNS